VRAAIQTRAFFSGTDKKLCWMRRASLKEKPGKEKPGKANEDLIVDAIGLRIDCVLDMKTSARCERGHHAVA
jgi:hypothetical protein